MDLTMQMDAFDRQNPDVERLFEHFTFDRIKRGYPRYSANLVLEHTKLELPPAQGRRLKTHSTVVAWYAAKFEAAYPEHTGFLRVFSRQRRS